MKKEASKTNAVKLDNKKSRSSTVITATFLSNIEKSMINQLITGKIQINRTKTILNNNKNVKNDNDPTSDPSHQLKLIQSSLKQLKNNMLQQKKAEKAIENIKLLKAKELIQKVKKQKQEHQQKLQHNSQKNILFRKLFSDTAINKMRQRIDERIVKKRQEIEQRIKSIEARKYSREIGNIRKNGYSSNKQIRNIRSISKLPSLSNPQPFQQLINLPPKNSMDLIEKYPSQQNEKTIDHHQPQQTNLKPEKVQQRMNQRFKARFSSQQLEINPQQILNSNEFIRYHDIKSKLTGNQSSVMLKNSSRVQNESLAESVELIVQQAPINQNEQIEKLNEKWSRVLSKIQHKQILLQQGLSLLNSLQKRLDKVNIQGITYRLKKKYSILSKEQPNIHK